MVTATLKNYDNDDFATTGLITHRVASGFQFTEGPLWHPDGYLLFSDIPANKIYKLVPGHTPVVYLDNSGFSGTDSALLSDMIGSNGLAMDENRYLVFCQHGDHSIARLNDDHSILPVVTLYQDRPFNSPNDLTISSDGSIYFTDPPYGLKDQVLNPSRFQARAGLYRYHRGQLKLLSTDLRYPNGICFSPCEQFLYAGSNHPDEPFIWRYTLTPGGDIVHRFVLARQNADGIKTDPMGRLFLATDKGVMVLSAEGKKLALIPLPETPSNLTWGGRNGNDLFITARTSVYRISQSR